MKLLSSATVGTIALALFGSIAFAETYDSVQELLQAAKQGDAHGKVLLREVLVVTPPEHDDSDDDAYVDHFLVQDFVTENGVVRAVGEALAVRIETYYFGHDPFSEESDDPYEEEVPVTVKKGDVISFAADLDKDWDDDSWVMTRGFEDDFYDDDMYEVYVEGGVDVEDFQHASDILGRNWGIDDLADFSSDNWSQGDPAALLAEFNEFLVDTFGFEPITKPEHVDQRSDALWELDHGIRAVFTVHAEGVKPIVLTPSITYMRPFTRLRQGTVATVKVTNPGAAPQLRLDGMAISVLERRPGLMLIQIPASATPGAHELTLVNEGQTSRAFKIWVKQAAPPDNPAPILDSATVVGSDLAAVLVLEGNHFKQDGPVTVYVGRRKVEAVLSRQHRTLIVELPEGISGKTARVRVGNLRSNSVRVHGLKYTRRSRPKPAAETPAPSGDGFNQALGQD